MKVTIKLKQGRCMTIKIIIITYHYISCDVDIFIQNVNKRIIILW